MLLELFSQSEVILIKAVHDMDIFELLGEIIDLVDEVTPQFLKSYVIILATAFNC